jgi:uncharacterized membrane protein
VRIARYKILLGLVLIAGTASLLFTSTSRCSAVTGRGEIVLNVSSLARGAARMFCYTDDAGKKLRFVLARGSDGKLQSVFDACRQCFTYHRGYQVVGNDLICRVCGNHYPIEHMTNGKASCVPASLEHRELSDTVRIKTSDLQAGSALF